MIGTSPKLIDMVNALRGVMGSNEPMGDFVQPSLLREVPSISTPDTNYSGAMRQYAELGGSAFGDRR